MAGFEIARFYMDKDTVIEMSEPGTIRGISDRQDRFTFYLHHSSLIVQQHHTTQPGRYGGTLTLRAAGGPLLRQMAGSGDGALYRTSHGQGRGRRPAGGSGTQGRYRAGYTRVTSKTGREGPFPAGLFAFLGNTTDG